MHASAVAARQGSSSTLRQLDAVVCRSDADLSTRRTSRTLIALVIASITTSGVDGRAVITIDSAKHQQPSSKTASTRAEAFMLLRPTKRLTRTYEWIWHASRRDSMLARHPSVLEVHARSPAHMRSPSAPAIPSTTAAMSPRRGATDPAMPALLLYPPRVGQNHEAVGLFR